MKFYNQASYMIRRSSEWFKFHDDNDPRMKTDKQTFTQWTIILINNNSLLIILSIFDVTTSISLFLLIPPSNFHSTVNGKKKMKDSSFEGIFTYLIGEKWCGLFGIWVWFYMTLVELKCFKGKQKAKFNCFYCHHLNFIDNLISFKRGNIPANQGSFFSSLS